MEPQGGGRRGMEGLKGGVAQKKQDWCVPSLKRRGVGKERSRKEVWKAKVEEGEACLITKKLLPGVWRKIKENIATHGEKEKFPKSCGKRENPPKQRSLVVKPRAKGRNERR